MSTVEKKRYKHEPTLRKLKERFPYSIEVPHGFKTHAQQLCRKNLGPCWYRWAPQWYQISPWEHRTSTRWITDERAVWQYRDGRLYFKHEADTGMLTLAVLSKPKRKS